MYARYTEYLRDLMQNEVTKAALDKALSTYPLYTSKNPLVADLIPTREQLNTKLLNHYKYREIGFEVPGRFIDELEIVMCEIMPRYNELYKTVEIMAELPSPFDNVDVIEEYTEEKSSTSSSEGNTTSSQSSNGTQSSTSSATNTATNTQKANSKNVESDTPQNSLNISAKGIDTVDYASTAKWNEDEGTGSSNASSSGSSSGESSGSSEGSGTSNVSAESTERISHTFTKKGNQGVNTYAHDMNEFRTSIIDVTEQIINDSRISELFMLVY